MSNKDPDIQSSNINVPRLNLDSNHIRGKSEVGRRAIVGDSSGDGEFKVHPLTTKHQVQSKSVGRNYRLRNASHMRNQKAIHFETNANAKNPRFKNLYPTS